MSGDLESPYGFRLCQCERCKQVRADWDREDDDRERGEQEARRDGG